MSINKRYVEKFTKAYEGLQPIVRPLSFTINSPYRFIEEWREVLDKYVPGVLPHTYWISTHGRVYTNLKSPKYPNGGVMTHSINQKGYHQINLQSTNGKKIGIKITRLIMLHFCFIPGCEYFEIDHLDANKDNNCLWNLQWVTPQQNTHRAIMNDQRPLSCKAEYDDIILDDKQARELFMLSLECNCKDDYEILSTIYGVSENYIKGLRSGAIRPYIRKQFKENNTIERRIDRIL